MNTLSGWKVSIALALISSIKYVIILAYDSASYNIFSIILLQVIVMVRLQVMVCFSCLKMMFGPFGKMTN